MSTAEVPHDIGMRIANRLETRLGAQRYRMWFEATAAAIGCRTDAAGAEPALEVSVPNQFVADWIQRNFHNAIREAGEAELGRSVAVSMRVDPEAAPAPKPAREPAAAPGTRPKPRAKEQSLRYRLDEFVVGPSNRLAYVAARHLLEDESPEANPVFVHGGCGLGKTHLLQGICQQMREQRPEARVLYTTGEQFTNWFLHAVRNNELQRFRDRIRRLELLAVDDVHFIADKQATRQEFQHSFDAIELGGARLALAGDQHPRDNAGFGERLISRCMRGMVVEVERPDFDTRLQIVRALERRRGLELASGVAERIAEAAQGSVRELEGLMTRIQAVGSLQGAATITHRLLQEALGAGERRPSAGPVDVATIVQAVAERLGIEESAIRGGTRRQRVVLGRGLTVYLARRMTSMSFPEIAQALGRRNHSTMVAASKRVGRQIQANEQLVLPASGETLSVGELAESLERALR